MPNRIAAPIRFILAYLNIRASVESDFGRAVIDILEEQYPNDPITVSPAEIGRVMMAKARKELQNDEAAAQDAIQELLAYFISAKTDFRTSKRGGKGAKTWREALKNIYSNLRLKAMSHSFERFREAEISDSELYAHYLWKKKMVADGTKVRGNRPLTWTPQDEKGFEAVKKRLIADKIDISKIEPAQSKRKGLRSKTLDEAFGTRPEGGGNPEGGEGKVPQGQDSWLGKALDDQTHVKRFFTVLDSIIPKLRSSLPEDQAILFDIVYEDEEGGFGSAIEENMNQSRAFREKAMKAGKKELADRVQRRPGALSEIRAKLLTNIRKYIENSLTPEEFQTLKDEYFSDTSQDALDRTELKKLEEKYKHWRDIELRKRKKMLDEMKSGKEINLDDLDKLQSKLDIQEEFGHLEYLMSRRKLTKEESVRYNDLLSEMRKREINYQAIPPIEHDLGQVDLLAKLKWLDKNKELTPEQDALMDETWDALLDEFPANVVESIQPVKPKSGEKLATSLLRVALRLSRIRLWMEQPKILSEMEVCLDLLVKVMLLKSSRE